MTAEQTAPRYMASHKGATGPVCDTPIEAATAYAGRYPKARACVVVSVKEGPAPGLVSTDYRGGRWDYVIRKGVPNVA